MVGLLKEAFNMRHVLWISRPCYTTIVLLIFLFLFFHFVSSICLHSIMSYRPYRSSYYPCVAMGEERDAIMMVG
jgi:hypothetical protein